MKIGKGSIVLLLLCLLTFAGCGKQEQIPDTSTKEVSVETEVGKEPVDIERLKENALQVTDTSCEVSEDGLIKTVEINQVMSYGMDYESGKFYLINDFVAGKDTAIYVPLTKSVEIDSKGNTQYLKITKDDVEVATLTPSGKGETDVLCFKPKKMDEVDSWSEGEYNFEVTVGQSWGKRNAVFRSSKKIKVLAVPIKANYGGQVVEVGGAWQEAIKFTAKTYPLGKEDIQYIYAPLLDLSGSEYDLYTEEGMYNAWRALCYLQTPTKDYELVLGFVKDRVGPTGTYQGFTCGSPANIIVESDGDMQATVAHEIAHCYNVGDEYEGGVINEQVNPAPYGMRGENWNDRSEMIVGKEDFIISGYDMGKRASGTVIFEEQRPVDLSGEGLNQNVTSFMGSGSEDLRDYWITSAIWEQLYRAFVGPNSQNVIQQEYNMNNPHNAKEEAECIYFNCHGCYQNIALDKCMTMGYCETCEAFSHFDTPVSDGSFKCTAGCGKDVPITEDNLYFECYNCGDITSFYNIKSTYEVLYDGYIPVYSTAHIMGKINKQGEFTPEIFEKFYCDADKYINTTQGEYGVYMEDEKGKVLYSYLFDVNFTPVSTPDMELEEAPIDLNVKCPSRTRSIVVKKDDKELYRKEISLWEPEITIDIEEGVTLSGTQKITWVGTDEDGDDLTYNLWYYGDGDPVCLASHTKETSCMVNFDELPGSDTAFISVEANDGFLVSFQDSNSFNVAYKKPTIITDATIVSEFKVTDYAYLEVDAYDLQAGWSNFLDFVWVDEEGEEVSGDNYLELAPYTYEPGKHTFTVTVSNWQGLSVSQTFTINIIDDESALVNDWSREEVRTALQAGFDLPVDDMSTNINRAEFAKLAWKYYEMISDDSCILFEVEGIDDCDYYEMPYPFFLLKKGLIEVKNKSFDPLGYMTQSESLSLLMTCTSQGDKAFYDAINNYDKSLSLPQVLTELGVFDQEGENKYRENELITKEQAMVRVIRLLWVYFDYYEE